MDTINLYLYQETSLIFVAYVFSMVSSSTSPKFIPELLLWPLEILIKVKFVLSSFDSTADMARVAFPPVKRHPRYAVGSRKITLGGIRVAAFWWSSFHEARVDAICFGLK